MSTEFYNEETETWLPDANFTDWSATRVTCLSLNAVLILVFAVLYCRARRALRNFQDAATTKKQAYTVWVKMAWQFFPTTITLLHANDRKPTEVLPTRLRVRRWHCCGCGPKPTDVTLNAHTAKAVLVWEGACEEGASCRAECCINFIQCVLVGFLVGLWLHFIPCLVWTCDWGVGDGEQVRGIIFLGAWLLATMAASFCARNYPMREVQLEGTDEQGRTQRISVKVPAQIDRDDLLLQRQSMKASLIGIEKRLPPKSTDPETRSSTIRSNMSLTGASPAEDEEPSKRLADEERAVGELQMDMLLLAADGDRAEGSESVEMLQPAPDHERQIRFAIDRNDNSTPTISNRDVAPPYEHSKAVSIDGAQKFASLENHPEDSQEPRLEASRPCPADTPSPGPPPAPRAPDAPLPPSARPAAPPSTATPPKRQSSSDQLAEHLLHQEQTVVLAIEPRVAQDALPQRGTPTGSEHSFGTSLHLDPRPDYQPRRSERPARQNIVSPNSREILGVHYPASRHQTLAGAPRQARRVDERMSPSTTAERDGPGWSRQNSSVDSSRKSSDDRVADASPPTLSGSPVGSAQAGASDGQKPLRAGQIME